MFTTEYLNGMVDTYMSLVHEKRASDYRMLFRSLAAELDAACLAGGGELPSLTCPGCHAVARGVFGNGAGMGQIHMCESLYKTFSAACLQQRVAVHGVESLDELKELDTSPQWWMGLEVVTNSCC